MASRLLRLRISCTLHVWLLLSVLISRCGVQTSIITEGFRSLAEGEPVEFYVESGDDGRTKAVQVTGPSGAPPQVHISVPVAT